MNGTTLLCCSGVIALAAVTVSGVLAKTSKPVANERIAIERLDFSQRYVYLITDKATGVQYLAVNDCGMIRLDPKPDQPVTR